MGRIVARESAHGTKKYAAFSVQRDRLEQQVLAEEPVYLIC